MNTNYPLSLCDFCRKLYIPQNQFRPVYKPPPISFIWTFKYQSLLHFVFNVVVNLEENYKQNPRLYTFNNPSAMVRHPGEFGMFVLLFYSQVKLYHFFSLFSVFSLHISISYFKRVEETNPSIIKSCHSLRNYYQIAFQIMRFFFMLSFFALSKFPIKSLLDLFVNLDNGLNKTQYLIAKCLIFFFEKFRVL